MVADKEKDFEGIDLKRAVILLIMFGLIFYFWRSPIVYPIKMFVVFLHELSHGLAAVLTGGSIVAIKLDYRIGGLCIHRGGSLFITASAGYLGSLLWGGLILIVTTRFGWSKAVALVLGILICLVTFIYIPMGEGWLFSIGFSLALIAIAFWAPPKISDLLLMFIGLTSCLYVIIDIKEDLITLEYRGSDADALAELTHLPALFWGISWALASLVILTLIMVITLRRSRMSQAAQQ